MIILVILVKHWIYIKCMYISPIKYTCPGYYILYGYHEYVCVCIYIQFGDMIRTYCK